MKLSDNGKEYYGKISEQMHNLIAEGRHPINIAYLMMQRIGEGEESEYYQNNYFYTSDSLVFPGREHGRNAFKLCLKSPRIRSINSNSKIKNGSLIILSYNEIEGMEFDLKDKNIILNRDLTKEEALNSPVWNCFAGNSSLLEAYVDKQFHEGKRKYKLNNMLGIYLSTEMKMGERAAYVGGLVGRSQFYGWDNLDNGSRRLVGVAPEALSEESMNNGIQSAVRLYQERKERSAMTDVERQRNGIYHLNEISRIQIVSGGSMLKEEKNEQRIEILDGYIPLELPRERSCDGDVREDKRIIPLQLP